MLVVLSILKPVSPFSCHSPIPLCIDLLTLKSHVHEYARKCLGSVRKHPRTIFVIAEFRAHSTRKSSGKSSGNKYCLSHHGK
jgi:hypothetical protein